MAAFIRNPRSAVNVLAVRKCCARRRRSDGISPGAGQCTGNQRIGARPPGDEFDEGLRRNAQLETPYPAGKRRAARLIGKKDASFLRSEPAGYFTSVIFTAARFLAERRAASSTR
ncbi:MAG: hypothetical protein AMXMBFR47_09910 [Planctomycetota bacterium]